MSQGEDLNARGEELRKFSAATLSEWDEAMDRFFTSCDRVAKSHGWDDKKIEEMIGRAYGSDVADEYREWADQS